MSDKIKKSVKIEVVKPDQAYKQKYLKPITKFYGFTNEQKDEFKWTKVLNGEIKAVIPVDSGYSPKSSLVLKGYGDIADSEITKDNELMAKTISFSTAKVAETLFDQEDTSRMMTNYTNEKGVSASFVYDNLGDSITHILGGVHFNSSQEIEEYFSKLTGPFLRKMTRLQKENAPFYEFKRTEEAFERINPFQNVKLSEFEFIDWKFIWSLMEHTNDIVGQRVDYGLTGSVEEQYRKDNENYDDLIDKMNTRAPKVSDNDRKLSALNNAVIIIKGLTKKITDLSRCPQANDVITDCKNGLKRTVLSLYQTFGKIPNTYDPEVNSFLSKCKLA